MVLVYSCAEYYADSSVVVADYVVDGVAEVWTKYVSCAEAGSAVAVAANTDAGVVAEYEPVSSECYTGADAGTGKS